MEAVLNEEELLLRESVLRQVEKLVPSSVPGIETFEDGPLWSRLAGAELLSMGVPEDLGGGGTITDLTMVMSALAQVLAPVPFLGSGVLATQLLVAAQAPIATLEPLFIGGRRLAVAFDPAQRAVAVRDVDGPRALAWDAAGADAALLLRPDRQLVAVGLGDALPGFDLTRQVRPCDTGRTVEIGDLGGPVGEDSMERWRAIALTTTSADVVGVMTGALRLAIDHAKSREQFGVPIGSFQAIQHILADAHVSLEGARSATMFASWAIGKRSIAEASLAAHVAKAYCSDVGPKVCEAVIQVHGGMGMTWESLAHLFLRRVLVDRALLGDETVHYQAIAARRRQSA